MKITKATERRATLLGVEICEEVHAEDRPNGSIESVEVLAFYHVDSMSDAGAWYRITDDGLFFVDASCGEDWPHWIKDNKALRSYLVEFTKALADD